MLAIGFLLLAVALLLVLVEAHLTAGGLIASVGLVALVSAVTLLLLGAGAGLVPVLIVGLGVLVSSATGLLLIGRRVRSTRRLRPRAGTEAMVGRLGVVRTRDSTARVFVDGGLWRAQPSLLSEEATLHDGERVVVERVNGLTLGVRRAEEWELSP